jgi:flavin-dependent dehydrogenase
VKSGGPVPYEVIILGGGPAGAAAALALRQKGCSVGVVTKPASSAPRVGETVPPEIIRPLSRLGLWERFLAANHLPAPGTVVVWGDDRPYDNDSIFNPYGSSWHLERARFDSMLLDAAEAAGARVIGQSAIDCVRQVDAGWTVSVEGSKRLVGDFVIDATGRAAWLGKRIGARRVRADGLVGLVRFASETCINEPRTLIEATREGWWYAAALPQQRVVAALFTDADLLPHSPAERLHVWDRMLAETQLLSSIVPRFPANSPIQTVAANGGRLLPCAGENWLAIGDAAQWYDPLSGQGLLSAIESGLQAAGHVAQGHADSGDPTRNLKDAADQQYERYLAVHQAYYRREQRWPNEPFWQRRHCS